MPSDRIKYSFGLTINLGNFESGRVDVGMETDVGEDETPEEAFDRIKEIVEEKAEEQAKEHFDGARKGK